jgi:hypothetical protein
LFGLSSAMLSVVVLRRVYDTLQRLDRSFGRCASLHSNGGIDVHLARSNAFRVLYLLVGLEDVATKRIVHTVARDETEDLQILTIVRDVEHAEEHGNRERVGPR